MSYHHDKLIFLSAATASTARGLRIYHGDDENCTIFADGSAIFKGAVQTAGGVVTPSAIIQTEVDNPANYIVTTSTDEEDNEVETRVYNGPTLDVKEALLALQQKVNDRDAVMASLTTRIAALEAQAA